MSNRVKLLLVLTIVAFFVLCGLAFRSFVGGSDDYVRQTMPALLKSWDQATLRKHLNEEKFSDADVAHIAATGPKVLGEMTSFHLNRATFSKTQSQGKSFVRMCYAVPATFTKGGSLGVMFYVAQIDGRWQVVDFDVGRADGNNLFKPGPAAAFPKKP